MMMSSSSSHPLRPSNAPARMPAASAAAVFPTLATNEGGTLQQQQQMNAQTLAFAVAALQTMPLSSSSNVDNVILPLSLTRPASSTMWQYHAMTAGGDPQNKEHGGGSTSTSSTGGGGGGISSSSTNLFHTTAGTMTTSQQLALLQEAVLSSMARNSSSTSSTTGGMSLIHGLVGTAEHNNAVGGGTTASLSRLANTIVHPQQLEYHLHNHRPMTTSTYDPRSGTNTITSSLADFSEAAVVVRGRGAGGVQLHAGTTLHEDDVEAGDYEEDQDDEDLTTMGAAGAYNDADDDAATRLRKSRARNREHARRTRLRKKVQLTSLQTKYRTMLAEKQRLDQKLHDRSIASILLGLSSSTTTATKEETAAAEEDHELSMVSAEQQSWTSVDTTDDFHDSSSTKNPQQPAMMMIRRKRGWPQIAAGSSNSDCSTSTATTTTSASPLTVVINGVPTTLLSRGKSHINWKSGTYSDEEGRQLQLSAEQLEALRRERNRIHAKMTRDRKKCFLSTMEQAIDALEQELVQKRARLQQLDNDDNDGITTTTEQQQSPSASHSKGTTGDNRTNASNQKATTEGTSPSSACTVAAGVVVTPDLNAQPGPADDTSSTSTTTTDASPPHSQQKKKKAKRARRHGFRLDDISTT